MKIVSDHGWPKGDMPGDDAFDRFKNERDYINQSGRMKTTVAAMDWAAAEIERLTKVYEAARGLCHGYDWNAGNHAVMHRNKLVNAVDAISPVPDKQGKMTRRVERQ